MKVILRTLTPLWTGGVEGKVDRIYETGILGSLRWWYEALMRGLGGRACDPSQTKCAFDAEKYARGNATDDRQRLRDAGLCDVCQVFGATGWQRRFRLEMVEDRTQAIWQLEDDILNIRPPDRARGGYRPPGRMGTFALHIIGEPKTLSLMAALLLFVEKWGALGAKSQLGYGVFRIDNRDEVRRRARGDAKGVPGWNWELLGDEPQSTLPDLRQFGFLRYRFAPEEPGWWTEVPGLRRVAREVQLLVSRHKTVPVSPALKNEWRFHRWQNSRESERAVFGTLRPERRQSTVSVSWGYQVEQGWEVRGWAWLFSHKWAKQTWDILTDTEGWRNVLGIAGNLEERRFKTAEQVLKLLEETR